MFKSKIKYIGIIVLSFAFLIGLFLSPSLKLKEEDITIELNSEYKEPGYSAYILTHDVTNKVKVTNNIDVTKVGNYKVDYEFDFLFNYKKTRNIYVKEFIEPVIELVGDKNIYICPNGKYEELGYSATDNYDGDITNNVIITQTENEIVYKAVDSSGNEVIKVRTFEYRDNEAPVLNLNGGNVYLRVGSEYKEPGYNATDNCLGDITSKVELSGGVDTSKVGNYSITYKVSDGVNTVTKTRNIYVSDGSGNGVIYLTFDDGPDTAYTPMILDLLKKYNAKATFFIVPKGNTTDYLIKREYEEGHSLGIHSSSHVYSIVYASDQNLYDDINAVNTKIKEITGNYTYLYRYPGGSSNTVSRNYSRGIISRSSTQLHQMGFHYFDWNISSTDASNPTPSSANIARAVINNLSKNRENIVLMHDVKRNTAYALEEILQFGVANGYRFEPITMSTREVHHGINN